MKITQNLLVGIIFIVIIFFLLITTLGAKEAAATLCGELCKEKGFKSWQSSGLDCTCYGTQTAKPCGFLNNTKLLSNYTGQYILPSTN